MNWKKILKYSLIVFIVLMFGAMTWLDNQGKLMYGGLTEVVDHQQFTPTSGPVVIRNVNVLAPDGEQFIPDQSILVKQNEIVAIDSAVNYPSGATIIDGKGKYLIPGLIDAHVHLFKSPNDLLLYIANGVTEIRELIGEEDHLTWKKEIESGRIGPKMFVASPRLGSFEMMEGWMMAKTQGFMNVPNGASAKEIVRELHDQGYDGLKIYSHLNRESYLAVTKTAKELGMPVFGHIPFDIDYKDLWENGQSDIAHFEEIMNALQREFGNYKGDEIKKHFGSFKGYEDEFLSFVEERSDDLANKLIKHDISVTSTLWLTQSFVRQKVELNKILSEVELAYENPGLMEGNKITSRALGWLPEVNRYRFLDNVNNDQKVALEKYWNAYGQACQILARNLSQKGVKIMAGTDANLPVAVPGFSLHDELISLNEAGLSTSEVLRSATTIPATWLKSNSGKIAVGYEANMILLDKNPLVNISHTKTINTVIAGGRIFDRSLIDRMLEAVKEANNNSRQVHIHEFE